MKSPNRDPGKTPRKSHKSKGISTIIRYGERLRSLRISHCRTLQQLAQESGYAATTISGVENGRDLPSGRFVQRMEQILGTTESDEIQRILHGKADPQVVNVELPPNLYLGLMRCARKLHLTPEQVIVVAIYEMERSRKEVCHAR